MTEAEITEEVQPVEESVEAEPETEEVHCHWCGKPRELTADDSYDWLCDECGRFQDAMTCPTCHQLTRRTLMPQEMIPEAHAPSRRRKAKED